MITNLSYEGFVKRIFGTTKGNDPLLLADGDLYRFAAKSKDAFINLKLGVAYSLKHFMVRMEKEKWNVPGRSKNQIDREVLALISDVMLCDSLGVLDNALERGIELLSSVGQ